MTPLVSVDQPTYPMIVSSWDWRTEKFRAQLYDFLIMLKPQNNTGGLFVFWISMVKWTQWIFNWEENETCDDARGVQWVKVWMSGKNEKSL